MSMFPERTTGFSERRVWRFGSNSRNKIMKIKSWFGGAVCVVAAVLLAGCATRQKPQQVSAHQEPATLIGAILDQNNPHSWFDFDGREF